MRSELVSWVIRMMPVLVNVEISTPSKTRLVGTETNIAQNVRNTRNARNDAVHVIQLHETMGDSHATSDKAGGLIG